MPAHGDRHLAGVHVDDYSVELRGPEGLIGDRASMRGFAEILERERQRAQRRDGADPLAGAGQQPSKDELDHTVTEGDDPEAARLVLDALDRFSHELAGVVTALLRLPAWQATERIAVGGGMRGSRIGELAIARTGELLQPQAPGLELVPIWNDPDAAGLLGAVHLPEPEALLGYDSLLAADIGGSKMRVGCVAFGPDLCGAGLAFSDVWRHRDDRPGREQAVAGLLDMLAAGIGRATREGRRLAPVIGLGCPGRIRADGAIETDGQNLPGEWEAPFNLPARLASALPPIAGRQAAPLMHNDAVVQGLSEACRMQHVRRWGVLTIGTGLGNARFSNRR